MPALARALWHLASVQRFASGATICDSQMTWTMPCLWLWSQFCRACWVRWNLIGPHITADSLNQLVKTVWTLWSWCFLFPQERLFCISVRLGYHMFFFSVEIMRWRNSSFLLQELYYFGLADKCCSKLYLLILFIIINITNKTWNLTHR